VHPGIDTDCGKGLEIELDGVPRIGLEDDLELGVLMEAVGVLAVTTVIGANGRFDIGNIPGLGTEDAEEGGRVPGAGTDLGIIGLGDEAAMSCPEILELEDDGLEGGRHGFMHLDRRLSRMRIIP